MFLTREEGLQLVACLWADRFPLTREYFGRYLSQLLAAMSANQFDGRFISAALFPQKLEETLQAIEPLKQTARIIAEVGNIQDAFELDGRLLDAWAELRTALQLVREGFTDIRKTKVTADLTAVREGKPYAFQVKRINTVLREQVMRRNDEDKRDDSSEGEISDIHMRLDKPASWFFWDTVESKNIDFKKWVQEGWIRCLVIVSNDEDLQDAMVRHIACQQIRESIHQLRKCNFEELLWLPDLSNGAWFKVGATRGDTRCYADWCDDPAVPAQERHAKVNRRLMDLDRSIPTRNSI